MRPPGRWSRPRRTPSCGSWPGLLERLIDTEVRDLEAKRIHADELVRHVVAHEKVDLGHVGLTIAFGAGAGRVEDLLECDRRFQWRLREFAEADVLDRNIDF